MGKGKHPPAGKGKACMQVQASQYQLLRARLLVPAASAGLLRKAPDDRKEDTEKGTEKGMTAGASGPAGCVRERR